MGETSHCERLYVIWQDEFPPRESGARPRGEQKRQSTARAGPDFDAGDCTCGPDHVDQVTAHRLAQLDALHRLAHGQDGSATADLGEVDLFVPTCRSAPDHVPLGVPVGITDRNTEKEPVELCFGKRVRALVLASSSAD